MSRNVGMKSNKYLFLITYKIEFQKTIMYVSSFCSTFNSFKHFRKDDLSSIYIHIYIFFKSLKLI